MTTLLDVQGRRTVGYLTNKSGGAVVKGDVVILDSANDEAFTTSTAGAEVVAIGVVTETNGIASNAQGRVAFQGYVDLVNVNASVTRGHFGKTHTVAKQAADAGASRVLGVFCQFLTGGTTPTAMLMGQPDGVTGAGGLSGGTPALTFSTSNAAGSASSGIRTDATIALFDATAPSTLAFGGAAAAGSAGVAARRDHGHGMPADPSPGAATSWTPALTAASVNPTLGSGSAVEGHYVQLGKLIIAWGSITFGTSGVNPGSGEYHISLPVNAVTTSPRIMGTALCYDNSATRFFIANAYFNAAGTFRIAIGETAGVPTASDAGPMVWAASDALIFQLSYEAA